MKFFLDTANLEQIKKANALGLLDGVTTNPSLVAKENQPFEAHEKKILKEVKGPVSVEVVSQTSGEMLKEARTYAKWGKNVVVKLPMTPDGLKALRTIRGEGHKIKTNVTLVFSAAQGLLAMKLGATMVSPFIGRLDDKGLRGMDVVEDLVKIKKNYGFKTEILTASVRTVEHIRLAALAGSDIATMPYSVFEQLWKHELTDIGVQRFAEDWNKAKTVLMKK